MNDRMKLKQLRDSITRKIKESPTIVIYSIPAMTDDGFGGQIADPFGTDTTAKETIRISHEHEQIQATLDSPVGLSTSLGLFAMLNYRTFIKEGYEITESGGTQKYKVGVVDSFHRFGGVYMKQAPLTILDGIA